MALPDRTPLLRYIELQRILDNELASILNAAASQAEHTILNRLYSKNGIGAVVRRLQGEAAVADIRRQVVEMYAKIGLRTEQEVSRARQEAAVAESRLDQRLLSLVGVDTGHLVDGMHEAIGAGRTALEGRLLAPVPLAASVYKDAALASGAVGRLVNAGLVSGMSAVELADSVRNLIDPNVRGGVSYAAMRLGRTELSNAFHAAQIRAAADKPWINQMRWNLSGSHPRPDACNDYAEHGGTGLWDLGELPMKPHPHCLCYTTSEVPSRDDFVRNFKAGQYDDFLSEMGYPDDELGGQLVAAATKAPRRPKAEIEASRTLKAAQREASAAEKTAATQRAAAVKLNDKAIAARAKVEAKYSHATFPNIDHDAAKRYTPGTKLRDSLKAYTGSAYRTINGYLRTGDAGYSTGLAKDYVANIDKSMKTLKQSATVYRYTSARAVFGETRFETLIGTRRVIDPAYLSTSIDEFATSGFGELKMIVQVPEGTRAAYVAPFSIIGGESEMILDRGLVMELRETTSDYGRKTLTLRVVTPEIDTLMKEAETLEAAYTEALRAGYASTEAASALRAEADRLEAKLSDMMQA